MAIYFVRPKMFFFYWLSIQPYILPVFFILFKDSMMPMMDNYLPNLYFRYPDTMTGLMLLLFCVSYIREKGSRTLMKVILLPLILISTFLFLQNIIVGFQPRSLYVNIISILRNIAPFILLLIDKRLRPNRESVVKFIKVFVYVQFCFSILNYLGFRIYGDVTGFFDDSLICGTFTRYNHMTNYLASFFFILSNEYYECHGIKRKSFYLMSFLIGLLIVMSGSRMTLILFVFTAFYFFIIHQGKMKAILTLIIGSAMLGSFLIGNVKFGGQAANEGTGLERNLIGVVDLANSDDITEGNTLSMSAKIFLFYYNSPLMGNGKAFRPEFYYGHPTDTYNNEGIFRTDARLAFMFVEYGVIGLFLFLLLYFATFKGSYMYSEEKRKILYIGAFIYFLLFSLTDNGFWEYVQFSVLFIYVFSIQKGRGVAIIEKYSPKHELKESIL